MNFLKHESSLMYLDQPKPWPFPETENPVYTLILLL